MKDKSLKACSICKETKTLDCYNKKSNKKDGLQSHCKDCNKESSHAYYIANKENHKKKTAVRRDAQRIILQQYTYDFLKKNGCTDCGENDPVCLDFDHLRDKKMMISRIIAGGFRFEKLLEEINKCEIRCANCHRKKTAKDFNWYKNINTG